MAVYYGTVPVRTMKQAFKAMGTAPSKRDEEPVHVIVFDSYGEYFDAVQRISEEQYKKVGEERNK